MCVQWWVADADGGVADGDELGAFDALELADVVAVRLDVVAALAGPVVAITAPATPPARPAATAPVMTNRRMRPG
jgi:hypothetical protein